MYQKGHHRNTTICLGNLAPMDIEEYLSYLKYYEKDGVEHTMMSAAKTEACFSPLLLPVFI